MFINAVKLLLESRNWNGAKSPFRLLEIWQDFVNSLEQGYEMSIYEYDNDLSVRDAIEFILQSDHLKIYPEFDPFRKSVSVTDGQFRKLLLNDFFRSEKAHWWQAGVLRNGTKEYASDIASLYGFKISPIINN